MRSMRMSCPPGLSLVLVVSLIAASVPTSASGPDLTGVVVHDASREPVPGARVHVADPASGAIVASAVTGADGSFTLPALKAGTYAVAVEYDGGLYPKADGLVVGATSVSLDLAIRTGSRGVPQARKSLWANPLTAALVVVGAAVGVGVLIESATDNTEPPASPTN